MRLWHFIEDVIRPAHTSVSNFNHQGEEDNRAVTWNILPDRVLLTETLNPPVRGRAVCQR